MSPNTELPYAFPRAWRYAGLHGVARESSSWPAPFPYSERHLQCTWFDPQYRPAVLRSSEGEDVHIEHPGRWNLESGPDFLDAVLLVGPSRRRICGDVEIHIHPADWEQHGHSEDPLYNRVVAHVYFYPGRAGLPAPPRNAIHIALKDAITAQPGFSFESIDVAAYPYHNAPSIPSPCGEAVQTWPPEAIAQVLSDAGEERIRLKTLRAEQRLRETDPDQALYEEIMGALGYKANARACRSLARALPLHDLQTSAGGDATVAHALLLGVAGLLPSKTHPEWDTATSGFVRRLWDHWWKHQERWEPVRLSTSQWTLSGIRPQNRPERRLAAAASLFADPHRSVTNLLQPFSSPREWLAKAQRTLSESDRISYWSQRLSLGSRTMRHHVAILGSERTAAIIVNVLLPFMAAQRINIAPLLPLLPSEAENSLTRHVARALLGTDHNPALYSQALCRQGLLQIFHDFCVSDRAACRECPFAKALVDAEAATCNDAASGVLV